MLVKSRFALQMTTSTSSIFRERDITFEKCFSIAKIWRILYGRGRYEIYLRVVKNISRVSEANEYIIGMASGNQENCKLYSAQNVSHPRFNYLSTILSFIRDVTADSIRARLYKKYLIKFF